MVLDMGVLQTFVAVIDQGSVIAASRSRGYSAAAVSRQIGRLQRGLGVRLFTPEGRSIRPTCEALELAEAARGLIEEARTFERLAREVYERPAVGAKKTSPKPVPGSGETLPMIHQ